MNTPNTITEEALIERYPSQKCDLKDVFQQISRLPPQEQEIVLRAMDRYTTEAETSSYKAQPAELTRLHRPGETARRF